MYAESLAQFARFGRMACVAVTVGAAGCGPPAPSRHALAAPPTVTPSAAVAAAASSAVTPPPAKAEPSPCGAPRCPKVRALALGGNHSCALLEDGAVWCWGANDDGQLGDGTTVHRSRPAAVTGITAAAGIAAGDDFTCVVLRDGTVQCWGSNSMGQLGAGAAATEERQLGPVVVPGIRGVKQLAAGDWHALAIVDGGRLQGWGRNNVSQLGDGTETDRRSPTPIPGVSGVTQIAAGGFHSCALFDAGTVRCWGWNEHGQLGNGAWGKKSGQSRPVELSDLKGAVGLALGENHSCALVSGGKMRCWGSNEYGQLGDGMDSDETNPAELPNLQGAERMDVGGYHTCARTAEGSVHCWGNNEYGQIGAAPDERTDAVIRIGDFESLALGSYHTCASLKDGGVSCWGRNDHGQLGDGTRESRSEPTPVAF